MTTPAFYGGPPSLFFQQPIAPPAALQAAYHQAISADVASSVNMPDGRVLWLTGDVATLNGVPQWDPHNGFVMQSAPGVANFTPLTSPTFGSYQQVPNFPNGDVFWMGAGVIDNGVLHVFGVRVTLGKSAWAITVQGSYDATFNLVYPFSRLAGIQPISGLLTPQAMLVYQGIAPIPFGVSAVVQGSGGWWLVGTDNVGGGGCVSNCYQAHAAFVATGQIANYAGWTSQVIIPAGLNIGGVVDMTRTAGGGWTAWTKTDDIMGSTIQRMNAATFNGTWTITGTWPAPNVGGAGTGITYGVRVHPGQGNPSGTDMITVIENDSHFYGPQFVELPDK